MAIPLPKVVYDVEPGGGIVTGMRGANALTKSNLENMYYGPTQEANIASKNTYARYLPAQILGQVLANPLAWQTMDKNVLKQLTNQYASALANPPSIESLSNTKNMKFGLLGMLGDIFSNLKKGNQNALKTIPQENQQQQQNAFTNTPNSGEFGANNKMSDDEVSKFVANLQDQQQQNQQPTSSFPTSTINRASDAPGNKMPGSFGGENPAAIQSAKTKAIETTATTEAQKQADASAKLEEQANEAASAADNNLNLLDKLKSTATKLKWYEKGPIFGKLPGVTTEASDFDKAQSALADSVARAQQTGHITGIDRSTYNSMKPERSQPGEALKHQIDFNEGMNLRIKTKPAFLLKAAELGLNPTQKEAVWNYFIRSRPFYNSKSNTINHKNIDSWENFLTPQKIAEALNPSARPKSQSAKTNVVEVRTPDGNIWPIDKKHLKKVLKDYPGSEVI